MLVVVWNMARNSVTRAEEAHDRTWRYLEELDPDLALLQEATVPDWAREHWTVHAPSPDWWGSVVAAKPQLKMAPLSAALPQDLAASTIHSASGPELLVVSVYAPAVKAREVDMAGRDPASFLLPRRRTVRARDVAYVSVRDIADGRFLAAVDWNTSPQLDDW